jgi:hypothetical protein
VYAVGTQTSPPWGLDRIDDIQGLDATYNYQYTGADVDAFILDTPVANQDEFGGRFATCTSFTGESCTVAATHFHGSHVAGTKWHRRMDCFPFSLHNSYVFQLTYYRNNWIQYIWSRQRCHPSQCASTTQLSFP